MIQKISEAYFKLKSAEVYYRMVELDPQNAAVTELKDGNVIIYSSKMNREFFGKKFDSLKLLESSKEEFYKKYHEIKKEN